MILMFLGIKEECYPASYLPFEKIQLGVFTNMLYSKIIIKHLFILKKKERINTIKMTILPKAIYRLDAIPIKSTKAFPTELEQEKKKKKTLKFVGRHKRP